MKSISAGFLLLPLILEAAPSAKPTNTKVVAVTSSSFSVQWKQNNNGQALYTVIVASSPALAPVLASATVVDLFSAVNKMSSAVVSGLLPNRTYWASVNAWAQGKSSSPFSAPASSTTHASAPEQLWAEALSSAKVLLTWSKGANPPGTPYEISFSTDVFSGQISTAVSFSQNYTLTRATVSSLDPDTLYHFRVRGRNALKLPGPFSPVASARTLLGAPAAAPTFTTIIGVSSASLTVSWKQKISGSVTYVVVAATAAAIASSVVSSTVVQDPDSLVNKIATAAVSGLSPNTLYYCCVSVLAPGKAPSLYSSADKAYTLANPPAGTKIQVLGNKKIHLSWQANGNPGGTIYEISVSQDEFHLDVSTPISLKQKWTSFEATLPELSGGRTYWVRGRAANNEGVFSNFSEVLLFSVPQAAAPVSRDIYAYPVPWRPHSPDPLEASAAHITFANLAGEGEIKIFDLSGDLVRVLPLANTSQIFWDGKNSNGRSVASGVYLWRVNAGDRRGAGKLMVIR